MECKDLLGLFSDFYDNTLSAYKREAVSKHLLTCKRCSLKYKTFKEAVSYIKTVPDEILPESFYSGLDRKLEEAGKPFYLRFQPYLTFKNAAVGAFGVVFGLILGVLGNSMLIRAVPLSPSFVQVEPGKSGYTAAEKEKNTGRIIMRTGNVFKASYDLDRIVNRFDNAGMDSMAVVPELKQDPAIRALHKRYIITVNAGQYENLVKELNGLGYVMKLPDKKELADLKKLKPSDQIKLELDITEDGK
ncbi:MAG: hypothetical protein A2231_11610 [Candidatus Firestonebacteria bacterium RIFOXYA2_FULL_40_8]|nr:MAG: hypothetical protein A2231_11610 [Candidatus Firestonebacteria bacterium RIFOXYA2_FULL_40_8]